MKKSTVRWIAIGSFVCAILAFAAGMAYQLHMLKKIESEEFFPIGDDEIPENE